MKQQQRIASLLQKYKDKNISYEEYLELFEYLGEGANKESVLDILDEQYKSINPDADAHDVDWDTVYENIVKDKSEKKVRKIRLWKYAAAAALLLFLGYSINKIRINSPADHEIAKTYISDVEPAGDKAVLTLADGSNVILNGRPSGELAKQGNVNINKVENGSLVYKTEAGDNLNNKSLLNTLTTPRGGKYNLVLSDGTKVWLNAASSLKFPAAFNGKERLVELKGEGYFEVAKDKGKPFKVLSGDSEIEVLGTHFNIKNYQSESYARTTLLEGSIKYTHNIFKKVLVPGQQVKYNINKDQIDIVNADTEEVLSWRNGLFIFNNTNIDDIMKDISRWYDVDIKFEGDKPEISFTGVIPRSANASKVLKTLEAVGNISFNIEGKTITCSKKEDN